MNSHTVGSRASWVARLRLDAWLRRLMTAVRRWAAWLEAERRIRRNTEALMSLDDRMLADIGVSRSELAYIVRYGRRPSEVHARASGVPGNSGGHHAHDADMGSDLLSMATGAVMPLCRAVARSAEAHGDE